jgi:hypothetical protein
MFSRREKDHELYNNYNQDSGYCHCDCDTGCCAGIKSIFNKIRHHFIKPKNKNKNLNSKLLLGDDY